MENALNWHDMENLVLVACDNLVDGAVAMQCLTDIDMSGKKINVVTATRESDAVRITSALQPDLVIFKFSSNASALHQFLAKVKAPGLPIICLTRPGEEEKLALCRHNALFHYPLDQLKHNSYLQTTVLSILYLKQKPIDREHFPKNTGLALQKSKEHRTLSRYVMELDQKKKVLEHVQQRISELFPVVDDPTRIELTSIANSIKVNRNDQNLWKDFAMYFEKIDPGFISTISKKHPDLTAKDLKYCCYLKMNMSNADIQNLLGINQESVRTHKYRLKKKLDLPKEEKLKNYVRSFGSNQIH